MLVLEYGKFLCKGGALLLFCTLLLLGGQYLLPALLPFLVGALVAVLLRPLACAIQRGTGMRYRPSAVAAALLFYGLAGLLFSSLGFLLVAQTISFFARLPQLFAESLLPAAGSLWQSGVQLLARLLPAAGSWMTQLSQWLTAAVAEALSQLSAGVLRSLTGLLTGLPGLVFSLFLGVLSSFFILLDHDQIVTFLFRQLSPRLQRLTHSSKEFLLSTGRNVIKAYFLLMLLTFAETAVGLWLLGVEYYAVMGLVVAVVDVLPVLGSGAVLLPWGTWLLLSGRVGQGVGILLLWGLVTVVRTIAEPKILGDRIGLPPLVTILSMYLGLRLFGFAGLVLTPMLVTLLVHLNRHGQLRLWKGGDQP